MGRASIIATNFTGGELSPQIALGRVDIAKYNNGVRRLENCTLTVQGGAKRRPGTRFIAPTKDQTKRARLIEFVYNRGQAYVIEMGNGYIRFFKNRAQQMSVGVPYEVVSPYTDVQVPSVNYVQKSDTAFFVHEEVFPYRLQRYADVQWGMGVAPFITAPFEEQGHFPAVQITLSSLGPGAATVASTSNIFLSSDLGRILSSNGGSAVITGFTDNQHITLNIVTPFSNNVLPAGTWNLEGSPQDAIAPSSEGTVGKQISLNANFTYFGASVAINAIVSGVGSTSVQTAAPHGFSDSDTIQITGTGMGDGVQVIQVLDTTHFAFPSTSAPGGLGNTGNAQKIIASTTSYVWRGEDVGKVVSINGGLCQITAVINNSTANATVLRAFTSKIPAGANEWQLQSNAWNNIKGYPRAITINRQRLLFAGSPGYPQNLWSSAVQEYLNFQFGTLDDQAFRFELDGPRNSPIRHLAPARQLLVLTEADEMSLKGGQEKPITATNIQKTDESTVGSSIVRPVKVGTEMIFMQAAGKKVCAAGYRYDIDGFASPDRTVFATHITNSGISQLAHQKEPDSTLFAVRNDGQLAVCAYDIDQEVTGWGRWITNGSFESIATVPSVVGEDAYAIVQRSVNGGTKRYVEVFDPDMLVDCGISGTSVSGQAVWGGLPHLEGMTVQAWADGSYRGEFIVSGGSVTLPALVKSVQIGLGFTVLVEMLQPEMGGNGTTAQGNQVHVNEVILRVLDTTAAVINGEPIEFRTMGDDLLDLPPPVFTGDIRTTTLSDTIYTTRQVITQPYPLPFHLLDVIRRVTINSGD